MWPVTFQAVVFGLEENGQHIITVPACHRKADGLAEKTDTKNQTCTKKKNPIANKLIYSEKSFK